MDRVSRFHDESLTMDENVYVFGPWTFEPSRRRLSRPGEECRLEPKVSGLLKLLVTAGGAPVSKEQVLGSLWPGTVVNDASLARVVSKLRQALGDSSRTPTYIETIYGGGYQFLVPLRRNPRRQTVVRRAAAGAVASAIAAAVAVLTLAPASTGHWVQRGDDLYIRMTRAENASAAALYRRALESEQDRPGALAGLANTLVQRVIRYRAGAPESPTLTEAVASGRTREPGARAILAEALELATAAVRLAPTDPRALKALGFVNSALGDPDTAIQWYAAAVEVDPNAWDSLINWGELAEASGDRAAAVELFAAAYRAMERRYRSEPQRVGPWQGALGVAIGDLERDRSRPQAAAEWYRRVLEIEPFHPEATAALQRL